MDGHGVEVVAAGLATLQDFGTAQVAGRADLRVFFEQQVNRGPGDAEALGCSFQLLTIGA